MNLFYRVWIIAKSKAAVQEEKKLNIITPLSNSFMPVHY